MEDKDDTEERRRQEEEKKEKDDREEHGKKDQEEKQDEEKNSGEQDEPETDEERRKKHERELRKLLETLKDLEEEKKRQRKQKPPRMIRIEFGTAFHSNPLVNFLMYFLMNLVVMIALMELFGFVDYEESLLLVFLFVALYTFLEMLFRNYVLLNHFRFVMQTMGFIFFLGYLTIFFVVEHFIFPGLVTFEEVTHIIIFVGAFIFLRYILSHLLRRIILKTVR